MYKPRSFSKPLLFVTFLVIVLGVFACQNGEISSPDPATTRGIANPTFVRVLPPAKGHSHPKLSQSASDTISASEGGSIVNGHVTLVFPAGALDEDTEITILLPDPLVLVAEFSPDDLTFNEPVTMRWNLEGTTSEGDAENTSSIWYNEQTQLWEELESLTPPDSNTTETGLDHFSKYAQTPGG